jgi:cell division protein FtsN
VAHQTQDDGFHEIQLNGKQLVFLFMAATVVSVVIFLCGVLVGRGVRAERGGIVADGSVASTPPSTEPAPQSATAAAPPTPAGLDPRAAAPPPPADDLSYFDRLEKKKQPKEDLKKPAVEKSAPEKAAPEQAAPSPKPAPPKPAPAEKPTPPAAAPPAEKLASAAVAPVTDQTAEFTVQIAAYNARGEADAIAHRLTSKGYPAYVVPPGNGAVMYRVRVGRFKTRHDAEPVAARLQKEEQYKPWITR